jgi:hypothetical protein
VVIRTALSYQLSASSSVVRERTTSCPWVLELKNTRLPHGCEKADG